MFSRSMLSAAGFRRPEGVITDSLRGQFILQVSSIRLEDIRTCITIEPIIQRVFDLGNPYVERGQPNNEFGAHGHGHGGRDSTSPSPEFSRLIDAQGEKIQRLDTIGHHVVASFNEAVRRIDEEIKKVKKDIDQWKSDPAHTSMRNRAMAHDLSSAKREIKQIKEALQPLATRSHLEEELSSLKYTIVDNSTSLRVDFVDRWDTHERRLKVLESKVDNARQYQDPEDFRTLLESTQTSAKAALSASDRNAADIAALKAELRSLYRTPSSPSQRSPPSKTSPSVAQHEIDILTRRITKIAKKASQVETLQMEFELFKRRIERIERRTSSAASHREFATGALPQPEPTSAKRKAVSATHDVEDEASLTASSPSTAADEADDYVKLPDSPPPAKVRRNPFAKIPKVTKSGDVDKRTLRRRSARLETAAREGDK